MTRFVLSLFVLTSAGMAQQPDMTTVSGAIQGGWRGVRNNLMRAAEKMPEDGYAFKATPEVRTYAAWLGHAIDSTTRACATASGDSRQAPGAEKSQTTKEGVTAALKEALEYCDKVYASLTEASAAEKVKAGNSERPRAAILYGNVAHQNEHYGAIAVYLRLKGIVPPSSDRSR